MCFFYRHPELASCTWWSADAKVCERRECVGDDKSNGELYLRLMSKASEKGVEYLTKELARVEKMMAGGAMSAQKVRRSAAQRGRMRTQHGAAGCTGASPKFSLPCSCAPSGDAPSSPRPAVRMQVDEMSRKISVLSSFVGSEE